MEVIFPDSYYVSDPQFEDTLKTEFGLATWACSTSQDILKLNVSYMLSKSHIAQENYQDFLNFLQELQLKDQWEIMLQSQNAERETK